MFEDANKFVEYKDLRWSGILKSIKKSANIFQPLFEGFTNSLEAIRLRQRNNVDFAPYINIILNFNASLGGNRVTLADITIEDNGIGFDNKNFDRLSIYKDDTKGFNNRGSGRIQMIHSFQYVNFDSIYWDGTRTMKRKFALSKTNPFLRKNTILYKTEEPSPADGEEVKTTVKMAHPIEAKDAKIYAELGCEDIKKALFNHYLLAFCNIKSSFPSINIIYFVGGIEKDRERIAADEIPEPTQKDITISVPVCKMSEDMKRVENVENTSVSINVLPYKISSSILPASAIKITSKNEISETTKIKLTCIDPNASLDGYRYLFLLKSDYFDALDSDERGNIEIIDKTDFKKIAKAQGYIDEQIVLNDIQDGVNNKAREIYQEISIQNEHFHEKIEQLKRDYLLSEEALADVSLCDSVDEVFKKAYAYDAKIMAKESASYENSIQNLNNLDPSSDDYQGKLSNIVDQLVESLPIQNRTTLSKYVARRKMVIELMDKILKRMLVCQDAIERNVDEKLLHNLIFKQHSDNPLTSDLWVINEEYMYFKGSSESMLSKVKLNDERIFRDDFDEEEQRYLISLGENRERMRTDVLLFPSEGKCVIIEFKNPNVNLADCLLQISKYAYFLRNFTKPEYKFLTFYGYLIGESLEKRDVRAADGDFKTAPNLDYLFRPMKTVPDDSGSNIDGSLYMEVIQFSVLKERAELRNKAFIDRLMDNATESDNIGERV
ncbi:hypothetical protein CTI16_03810 [Prevotella intermedia]|uniref:Uncharacterized protein n=1 Tax=Prevotella intermedia TaxID=28131 RepID=A0AAJ3RJZ4_PREIN|nr:hypothetical protein [Prevotella intermedia]PIK18275.1 hypothetical protein CTI16_03810 [Prevotella intermedia]